ncbi:DMT family transporter [Streptomyces sp. NPDC046831]|uniref:DMT family transporter n=1 Tax=Streptomyces sp. NPDC046831 TaxID=3154805 RepID=UPI0033ECE2F6
MLLLAVCFALLGAVSSATGTAFQRKAASTVPTGGGLRLLRRLARNPLWVVGITGVIVSAVCQALALVNGPMALVQPLFILELPFALLIAGPLLHRRLPRMGWWAVSAVVAGLALVLASAVPSGGGNQAAMVRWIPVLVACLAAMGTAVVLARAGKSSLFRAAVLAAAAAVGNALTAALLKSASDTLADDGLVAFFTIWQTYGFAATGAGALLLLENALQAGSLAASQPALTIGDATVSLLLGVLLFDETVRLGWWLVPELLGTALLLWGVLRLARVVPQVEQTPLAEPAAQAVPGDGPGS